MAESRIGRYAIVECQVTSYQPYGLIVRLDDGARGFIDRADIADEPVGEETWPRIDEFIACVVLGYTRDGRVRASCRPRDIDLAKSSEEPGLEISNWHRVRDEGFASAADKASFFALPHVASILRWALRHRAGSVDYVRALEVLEDAPGDVVQEVSENE